MSGKWWVSNLSLVIGTLCHGFTIFCIYPFSNEWLILFGCDASVSKLQNGLWAFFKQRADWREARTVVHVIQIHLPRCTDGCRLGAHKGITVILLISSLSTMVTPVSSRNASTSVEMSTNQGYLPFLRVHWRSWL